MVALGVRARGDGGDRDESDLDDQSRGSAPVLSGLDGSPAPGEHQVPCFVAAVVVGVVVVVVFL